MKREWQEELSIEVSIGKLLYINDFSIASAFSPKDQLLSIYYEVIPLESLSTRVGTKAFDFQDKAEPQSFRWIDLAKIGPEDFTFPVDKKVAEMLRVPGFIKAV